jgi:hypothetical protein
MSPPVEGPRRPRALKCPTGGDVQVAETLGPIEYVLAHSPGRMAAPLAGGASMPAAAVVTSA